MEASRVLTELLSFPIDVRRSVMDGASESEWLAILQAAERDMGTPYGLWQDDSVGFVLDVLDESLWSLSRQLMESVPKNTRTAVPSCFSSSKSFSASRIALWWSMVYPPSTVQVVTIAPKWDQVKDIIWPEIRRAHQRSGLPGYCNQTSLMMPNGAMDIQVAVGVSGAPSSESGLQGRHSANFLLIVDEAGGLESRTGDNLRALLVGSNSRMLAIGNPADSEESTWFEKLTLTAGVEVVRISAYDTPNLTGEKVGRCKSCPAGVKPHPLSEHLIQKFQVEETIEEHGINSGYALSKVMATFPKGGANRVISTAWVEKAADQPIPEGSEWHRICDLGLADEDSEMVVREGDWIRLGVDVAADGGDEFVIARSVGDAVELVHSSSGADNESSVHVSGVVLQHIRKAEALRAALGVASPIRVKIDGIGVGWAVTSELQAWRDEGLHDAEIVSVVVSEKPKQEPDAATLRPFNKRAEMWLAMRTLLEPVRETGETKLRLNWLDHRARSQFSGPKKLTNSSGFTLIESKKSLRSRGVKSPDKAEAVAMCYYEPAPPKKRGRLLVV